MCDVPVFYATADDQTRRIAGRIAERIRAHGLDSRAIAIISAEASHMDWRQVRGVCLVASLHIGKHQSEAVAFARLHARTWTAVPSLFVSVSQSAASFHSEEVQVARRLAGGFGSATGWTPGCVTSVVGRLADKKHNALVTWMMRCFAEDEDAADDRSRGDESTDWQQVERVADQLALDVSRRRALMVAPLAIV